MVRPNLKSIPSFESDSSESGHLHGSTEATFPDVTIITKDGAEFKAHKRILLAQIPLLSEELSRGEKLRQFQVVKVNLTSKSLDFLLHYIYTEDIVPLTLNVEDDDHLRLYEIVKAAKDYKLDELIRYFDDVLIDLCSEDNVKFMLELAETFELRKAYGEIQTFIKNLGSGHDVSFDELDSCTNL